MIVLWLACDLGADDYTYVIEPTCNANRKKAFVAASDEEVGDFSLQAPAGYAGIPEISIYNFIGGGLVIDDFNGDGFDDIFLPTEAVDELYLGQEGGRFVAAPEWLPSDIVLSVGGAAADYDADGDVDLFVTTNYGADRLYRNEGDRFTDVTAEAGIHTDEWDTGPVIWGDYDLDGDLDLFVGGHLDYLFQGSQSNPDYVFPDASPNVLYTNDGTGHFSPSYFNLSPEPFTLAAAWLQYEPGERPDLYLINDFGPLVIGNRLLTPAGSTFESVDSTYSGADVDIYGMGIAIADLNGDRLPELWMSNWMEPVLLMSIGPQQWYNATEATGLSFLHERQRFSWGTALEDFDNDGDWDAWLGYGPLPDFETASDDGDIQDDHPEQPDSFFLNNNGTFSYKTADWGLEDSNITRGGLFVDLNQDGLLDLVRTGLLAPAQIFWGRCSGGNWLEVELRSRTKNTRGIGARVDVVAEDGQTWTRWILAGDSFASSGPPRAHFGLGTNTEISHIDVHWPNGDHTKESRPDINTRLLINR